MNKSTIISPKWAYLFISIPILAAICWSVFNYPLYTFYDGYDFWEHSATIREWSKNLWHPRNPHLSIDTQTPRYMPFFFLLTVLAKIFHLNALQALAIGSVMTMTLFLSGVWLFLRLYFRDDWAPFVGLIVLLAGWGAGWLWSNLYQLRCLFYVIAYPSSFVFALSFLSFWLSIRILRRRTIKLWNYITIGLISTLMFLSHPLTGAFAICSLCLLALLEPNVSFSHRCKLIAVVLTGALVAELWPYFSVWSVVLGTSGGQEESWLKAGQIDISHAKMLYWAAINRAKTLYSNHPFYDLQQVFVTLGPALLGIPALIILTYRRKHFFIVAGFVAMTFPYVGNLVFNIPLGHRFLLFGIFYLHLAIIWGILEVQSNSHASILQRASARSAKIRITGLGVFLTLLALWNVALSVLEFAGHHLKSDLTFIAIAQPVVEDMQRLSEFIPDEAIVLAPPRVGWPLPTFAGKVVALHHQNPMVVDGNLRRRDTFRFFDDGTHKEERLEILRRYRVTHILYDTRDLSGTVTENLHDFGCTSATINNYVIFKVRNDLW